MAKRTHFTTVTPLPPGITRETVLSTLHNHTEMIDLNPLVIERHPIRPPPVATPEEAHCQWYSITDKIAYLPAGLYTGQLNFLGCFHDLEDGLQTRVVAPMGLDMRGRWTLGGSLPGEAIRKQELGLGMPKQGLWLREDVDMKVNIMMTTFVKKTTKKAHNTLVERLIEKSHLKEADGYNNALAEQIQLREGYPPDYHAGLMSPTASTITAGPYGRESQYSTAGTTIASVSDSSSLRSHGGSHHGSVGGAPGPYVNPAQAPPLGATGPYHPQQGQHGYPPDKKYLYHQPPPHPAYPQQAPYPTNTPPMHQQHPAFQTNPIGTQSPPLEVRNAHPHGLPPLQTPAQGHSFAVELPSQGDKTPAELGSS